MRTKFSLIVIMFLVSFLFQTKAQTASSVLQKVDEITSAPKDLNQKLVITLIDKKGRKQVRKALFWQKGTQKRLFKFTEPASYKGIAFLSLPNNVMYLYMPAYGKERRIASSVKNQKFAGTDLSYDDMEAKKYTDKYKAVNLKVEGNYYILTLTPKAKSAYSKIILKVNKSDYLPVYTEMYDKAGHKIKTMETTFKKQGKYWIAQKIVVKDLKRNHSTILENIETQFDTNLSDDIFTVRNMKQ